MKLRELVLELNFEDVLSELNKHYDNINREAYEHTWGLLNTIDPIDDESNMKITITHVVQKWNDPTLEDDIYESVCGSNEEQDNWALEYNTFNIWLYYDLHEDVLKKYSKAEAMAHIIWEMTFNGYDNADIEEKNDELNEIMEQIHNGTAKTRPLSDLFKEDGE